MRLGRARLDEQLLAACLERMATASCPAALPPTAPAIAPRAFEECTPDRLFVGDVDVGGECRSERECAADARCFMFPGTCGGVCAPWSSVGDVCSGGCDPAVGFCDSASGRCVPKRGALAACEDVTECGAGLDCLGNVCVPPSPLGAPCAFSWNRLPYCAAGLACNVAPYVQASGVCVVRRGGGAACSYHWSCSPALVCSGIDWTPFPEAAPKPGTCSVPLAADAPCRTTPYAIYVGDECERGLFCDPRLLTCQPSPREGDACDVEAQACVGDGIWCRPEATGGGRCGPAPGMGEACRVHLGSDQFPFELPCRDGYCDRDTDTCAAASAEVGDACAVDAQCLTGRCVVQQDRSLKCGKRCD